MTDKENINRSAKAEKRGRPKVSALALASIRQSIIDAGGRAYGTYGYDRVTMAHILQEAGISRPTLYKYFPNKHEIIQALTNQTLQQLLQDVLLSVSRAGTALEQVDKAVQAYLSWGLKSGAVCRQFYAEVDHPQAPVALIRETVMNQLTGLFEQQIQAQGRQMPDQLMLDALIAMVEFVGSRLFTSNDISRQAQQRCHRIIMRILLASLATDDELALIPPVPMQVI